MIFFFLSDFTDCYYDSELHMQQETRGYNLMKTQWEIRYQRLRLQQMRQCLNREHKQPYPPTFQCSRQKKKLCGMLPFCKVSFTQRNDKKQNSIKQLSTQNRCVCMCV